MMVSDGSGKYLKSDFRVPGISRKMDFKRLVELGFSSFLAKFLQKMKKNFVQLACTSKPHTPGFGYYIPDPSLMMIVFI